MPFLPVHGADSVRSFQVRCQLLRKTGYTWSRIGTPIYGNNKLGGVVGGTQLQEFTREGIKTRLVFWPTPQDYNEAVQNPVESFADPTLKGGEPELTTLGLPRPITGMFASVYRMSCSDADWAVRCFLHNIPDQQKRYEIIENYLSFLHLPCMVGFDYQEQGVEIQGSWFPILKMEWCAGQNLNGYIERNLHQPAVFDVLANSFSDLMESLRSNGIAHGDLQHGNILIDKGELRLVDYDGMYVPDLAGCTSNELGHRNYQHPGRTEDDFGPNLDNFSAWLIYLSLRILSIDPRLWKQLQGGDECLLFRQSDLNRPEESHAFCTLEKHESSEIRSYSRLLRYLLSLPVQQVPPLNTDVDVPENLPNVNEPSRLPTWLASYEDATSQVGEASSMRTQGHTSTSSSSSNPSVYEKLLGNFLPGFFIASPNPAFQPNQSYQRILSKASTSGSSNPSVPATKSGYDNYASQFYKGLILYPLICALCGLALLTLTQSPDYIPHDESPPIKITYNANGESNLLVNGNAHYISGDYSSASAFYNSVINKFRTNADYRSRLNVAYAYNNLGNIAFQRKDFSEAENYYQMAIALWDHALGADSLQGATALTNLALVYENDTQWERAQATYEQALTILVKQGKKAEAVTRQCLTQYARLLRKSGNNEDAQRVEAMLKKLNQPSSAPTKSKVQPKPLRKKA